MAKFKLDISDAFKESLLFWLSRYLLYKAATLDNSKADKEMLQKALKELTPTPNSFEKLKEIALKIHKAGVAVYTLFYPVWLWAKENADNPDFTSLKNIDEEHIILWLSTATASKSDATKRNYKVALQDFFSYLSKQNEERYHFDINLSKWRKNLKNSIQKPPAFLKESEIGLFLEKLPTLQVWRKVNHPNAITYRAVFKIALATGMRVSEIAKLTIDDLEVDKANDLIFFHIKNSKAGKSRTVAAPYSKGKFAVKKELDEWLEIRNCPDKLLFCINKKKIDTSLLDKKLREFLKSIGIKKEKMGMHLLRHTHASYFYSKTKDPVMLQDRLGHSDPQTTRRYVHLEEEKIKKSVDSLR